MFCYLRRQLALKKDSFYEERARLELCRDVHIRVNVQCIRV